MIIALAVSTISIISITNIKILTLFLAINFLGNLFSSTLVLEKERYILLLSCITVFYSGLFYIVYSGIIQRKRILYDDKFLSSNTLSMNEGLMILNHQSEILYINPTASSLISQNFQIDFMIGSKVSFPFEEHFKFLGLKKTIELPDDKFIEIEYSKIYWNQELCNLVLITDVTQLKALESKAKEISWIHSKSLENIKEAILFFNLQGRITYANSFALNILGAKNEDLLGLNFENLFGKKEVQPVLESLSEKKTYTISREMIQRIDGSTFVSEYTVSPVVLHEEVQGAVLSLRDISNKIQREEIENNYKEQLLHLTHTSNKFLEIQNSTDLYQYISLEINNFFPDSFIIFNLFDPTLNIFTTKAHSGLKGKMNDIYEIFGRDLLELSFIDENYNSSKQEIQNIASIFDLKYGNFSRKQCSRLEFALEAKYIYLVPFVYKGLYLGNTLVLSKDNLDLSSSFEVFQNQCSINLFRDFMTTNSRKNLFRTDPFFENLSFEYIEMNLEGSILYANKAFESKSGFTNAEILGKNFWTTFLPELKLEEIHKIQNDFSLHKKAISSSPFYTKNRIPEPSIWEWVLRNSMDGISGIRKK